MMSVRWGYRVALLEVGVHYSDLATGAKSGTGSAMSPGLPIAMSEPMEDAWSTLLKEDDDVPDMSISGAPYDSDTRIPELSMGDLYRLLQHPNSRIRHKANRRIANEVYGC